MSNHWYPFLLLQMTMAMISFSTLHEHLQSPHSLPSELLMGQESLHFGDVCFALLQHTLNMQHVPLTYLKSLVAILIVFLLDNQHEAIQHIHIGLMVCHVGCTLYEQKAILPFIHSIEEDLERARLKQASGRGPGPVCSYAILVANFGGLMAIPTDSPYYLMYPNTYSDEVALENQNHFNIVGAPPGLCTSSCICCTLLQHVDWTEAHRQKYNGSHLTVPWGTQYKTLLPKITMPCNHWVLLLDLHSGKPFPMVPVGDFDLKDKIFPGMPGDSLLFSGDELVKLQRKRYQIPTYREEKTPDSSSQKEKLLSSCGSGNVPSSTSKEGESSKSSRRSPWDPSPKMPTDSPSRKSSRHSKHSPPSKEQCDKHKRTHKVCLSSTRTSFTVTKVAKIKKVTSLDRSAPCLCPNGCLPLKGWGRSPALRSLPWLLASTLRAAT